MPSFLDKLRSGSTGTSTTASAPHKKDGKEVPLTWLQKLAQDPEPARTDGSDKFFGAENFGNTCYFNSMVQSLYYSVPFREMVLAYPQRSAVESVLNDAGGAPRNNVRDSVQVNGQATASPAKKAGAAAAASARSAGVPNANQKPEDKDSPEYKKKQAMLHGPVLDVDYDNSTAYGMAPSLFTCLKDSFEAVIANKSRTGVLSMPRFLERLREENDMFRSPMHQDAHEFLNFLLNGVLDSVEEHTKVLERQENGEPAEVAKDGELSLTAKQSKEAHAQFRRLFQGTLTSETKCLTCENVSQRDEPFLDLSVDLEQHSSVTSCLRQFSEEEMLCERDKFFCDGCGGLQEAEKRMKVKRLPKVLALHLKRFKYTEDLQRLHKLFDRVVYPYQLRLFNTTDDADDPDKLYELYAVVVHIGSGPYHGHYVAIIKTPDRGWLLFDDELVEPVDKSFVRNFFGAQFGMACAYVLFYQETTLEAVKKEQEAEGLAAAATAAEINQPKVHSDEKPLHLNVKVNGVSDGPLSPSHEDDMAQLSHTATAPAAVASPRTPLSPSTHPLIPAPLTAAQGGPGSSVQPSKAEVKKQEKERKAAEKEREKTAKAEEKARRKSMDSRSKAQAAVLRSSTFGEQVPALPSNGNGAAPHGAAPQTAAPPVAAVTFPGAPASTARAAAAEAASPTAGEPTATTPQPSHHHSSSFSNTSASPTSGWSKPAFSALSIRRSSKSVSKKGKFWSLSSSEGKSGSVGASIAPPPTSAPSADAAAQGSTFAARPTNAADDIAVEDHDSGPEVPEKDPHLRPSTDALAGEPRGPPPQAARDTPPGGAGSSADHEATPPAPPKKRGLSIIRKKASALMSS